MGTCKNRFPDELATVPLLLPSRDNDIRASVDLMCEQHGCAVMCAEVDDMALNASLSAILTASCCCRQCG